MKKFCILLSLLFFVGTTIFLITYPRPYRKEVERTFCPALVYAIMKAESSFQEDALSEAGAVGLMQIMPSTAKFVCKIYDVEEGDLKDPTYNVLIGNLYLLYLKKRFASLSAIIAAYNAGEGNVRLWLKDKQYSPDGICILTTPFQETNGYLKKVQKNFKIYCIFYRKTLDFCLNLL